MAVVMFASTISYQMELSFLKQQGPCCIDGGEQGGEQNWEEKKEGCGKHYGFNFGLKAITFETW